MNDLEDNSKDDIELQAVLPWVEFGCWTAIVLFPFLYWINGPAVSTDQFVMRTILICVAVIGAIGLRFWNWRSKQRPRADGNGEVAETNAKSSDEVSEVSK